MFDRKSASLNRNVSAATLRGRVRAEILAAGSPGSEGPGGKHRGARIPDSLSRPAGGRPGPRDGERDEHGRLVFSSVGAVLGSRTELRGPGAARAGARGARRCSGGGRRGGAAAADAVGHVRADRAVADRVASLTILLRLARPARRARRGRPPRRRRRPGRRRLPHRHLRRLLRRGGRRARARADARRHGDTLARSNALKNIVLGIANAAAALAFCLLGPVDWAAVAPLAAGLFAGGRLGPVVVRHADARHAARADRPRRPRARRQARRRRVGGWLLASRRAAG